MGLNPILAIYMADRYVIGETEGTAEQVANTITYIPSPWGGGRGKGNCKYAPKPWP